MTKEQVSERLTKIIAEHLCLECSDVQPDKLLVPEDYPWRDKHSPAIATGRADLGADSLDVVELVMAAEEEFDIEIADDEATTLDRATVREFADFIHSKLEEA